MVLAIGMGQIPLLLHNHPALAGMSLRVLRYTPPFGAAAAMTGSSLEAASGLGIIVLWLLGLGAALVALERQPEYRQKVETTALSFDSPYDRVAAWFGPENAPLVAHWLRFYVRNNRFRTLSLLALPLLALPHLRISARPRTGFGSLFLAALGTFPIAGFPRASAALPSTSSATPAARSGAFSCCPPIPAAALRAGSYASMLLSAAHDPRWQLIAWVAFCARCRPTRAGWHARVERHRPGCSFFHGARPVGQHLGARAAANY